MSVSDKRVEEFAYYIWESEGRPDGQAHRHWEMAMKLADAEDKAPAKLPKKAPKKPTDSGEEALAKPSASSTKPKASKAAAKTASSAGAKPAPAKAAPKAAAEKKPRAPKKPAAH